jgi:CheY-like chemotaxis protein
LAPLERQAAPSAELPTMRASRATVLVVDDDEAVRSTTADILGALGYTVLQASDAVTALSLLEPEATIDVLLTDVAMPGMSGPELARQVRRMRPHLPIVFISGYADPEGLAGDVGLGRLVRKPFRSSELREQIEEALEEARAAVA